MFIYMRDSKAGIWLISWTHQISICLKHSTQYARYGTWLPAVHSTGVMNCCISIRRAGATVVRSITSRHFLVSYLMWFLQVGNNVWQLRVVSVFGIKVNRIVVRPHELVTKLHGVATQKATVSLCISPKTKCLTLIVLMWRIGWAHNNARK